MKIHVEQASGIALNLLVALAENMAGADFKLKDFCNDKEFFADLQREQEIQLVRITSALWEAEINSNSFHNKKTGPTPAIAALRAYAASHLGDIADLAPEVERLFSGALLESGVMAFEQGSFKNFHRSLCTRFGYTHDEQFWWRDLVSLEEFIAGQMHTGDAKLKEALAEADRRAGAAERELEKCRQDISRLNRVRDNMKSQWGVDNNVSFDIVWAQALALKSMNDSCAFELNQGVRYVPFSVDLEKLIEELITHTTHYGSMPNSHSDAYRHAANARSELSKCVSNSVIKIAGQQVSTRKSGKWIFLQGNEGDQFIDFDKELYAIDDEGKTSIDVRLTFNKENKTAYYTISLHNNDGNTVDWEKSHSIPWDVALRMIVDVDGCDKIPTSLAGN